MGQKVNPIGFRTGRTIGWKSRWFSDSANYKDFLIEDIKIKPEDMRKVVEEHTKKDTSPLGMSLYPHIIRYLQPLNISRVSNLEGRFANEVMPKGIENLKGLEDNLKAIAYTWPQFDASINPVVQVGTNTVRIMMFYDGWDGYESVERDLRETAEKYRQGKITPTDKLHEIALKKAVAEIDELNPQKYEQRSVSLSAKFENSKDARIGLRQLKNIFPEMLFEEELLAIKLPQEVAKAHKKARDYLHAHWCYDHGLGPKPDYKYDSATYDRLTKDANLQHMKFLAPHLEEWGIMPLTASYFTETLSIEKTVVPIKVFGDVIDLMAAESYTNPHIPNVSALFSPIRGLLGGPKIELDFSRGNGTFGIFDFAIVIENKDKEGTLEDILEKAQSITN